MSKKRARSKHQAINASITAEHGGAPDVDIASDHRETESTETHDTDNVVSISRDLRATESAPVSTRQEEEHALPETTSLQSKAIAFVKERPMLAGAVVFGALLLTSRGIGRIVVAGLGIAAYRYLQKNSARQPA